jgi:hypothetical protein
MPVVEGHKQPTGKGWLRVSLAALVALGDRHPRHHQHQQIAQSSTPYPLWMAKKLGYVHSFITQPLSTMLSASALLLSSTNPWAAFHTSYISLGASIAIQSIYVVDKVYHSHGWPQAGRIMIHHAIGLGRARAPCASYKKGGASWVSF